MSRERVRAAIQEDAFERRDKSTALIAMCTGGGMGTAILIERI